MKRTLLTIATALILAGCGTTHVVTRTVTKHATVPPTVTSPGESVASFSFRIDGRPSSCIVESPGAVVVVLYYSDRVNVAPACEALIKLNAAAVGTFWSLYTGDWGAPTANDTACELKATNAPVNAIVVDPSGDAAAGNAVCAELAAGTWSQTST
jgi:hypothetical protein